MPRRSGISPGEPTLTGVNTGGLNSAAGLSGALRFAMIAGGGFSVRGTAACRSAASAIRLKIGAAAMPPV